MSAEPSTAEEPNAASPPDESQKAECPFCVMMRKGGCEVPFKAFMDCGERADKSSKDMADCLPMYEALHACMDKNKAVFDALLTEMKAEEAARDGEAAAGGASPSSSSKGEGEGGGGGSGGVGSGGGAAAAAADVGGSGIGSDGGSGGSASLGQGG